jgi:hypothetical protein
MVNRQGATQREGVSATDAGWRDACASPDQGSWIRLCENLHHGHDDLLWRHCVAVYNTNCTRCSNRSTPNSSGSGAISNVSSLNYRPASDVHHADNCVSIALRRVIRRAFIAVLGIVALGRYRSTSHSPNSTTHTWDLNRERQKPCAHARLRTPVIDDANIS